MNAVVEKSIDERIAELDKNRTLNIHFGFMDTSIQVNAIPSEEVKGYFVKARDNFSHMTYPECFNLLFNMRQAVIEKREMSELLWSFCVIRLMDLGKLKQNNCNGVKFVYHEQVVIKKSCYNCFKPSKFRCQNCPVKYCSMDCQSCDWKFHKYVCDHSKKPV